MFKFGKLAVLSFTWTLMSSGAQLAYSADVLSSAGSMTFGADDVLFIGDTKAGMVHAFDFAPDYFNDQADVFLGRPETFEAWTLVKSIDAEIAALLGVHPYDVLINDMVVHGPSQQIFLSVSRGVGPDATPVIVQVNKGSVELADLTQAEHSQVSVGEIADDEKLEFGQSVRDLSITDIDFYNGEIFVAGVGTGDFASKLRRIKYPFDGEVSSSSIEIWHAVHAQFETRAPIISQEIRELNGVPTMIAAYACTPLVRIPLSELNDGARVRGEMIGELGYGNTPIDMISYTDPMDKNDYILVTNTSRSAKRIALDEIAHAEPMPTGVDANFGPAGVSQFPMPTEALHLDMLNPYWSVSIRRNMDDARKMDLVSIPLPFFLDRAPHVVEMNFASAPDKFGFRNFEVLER
ncbi:hypothetical protein B0E33_18770 [Roseibium algicola]|uniref:Uncharacterized protein n=1 Tax=Roseibium algicola TaxID=2857014 RepID=A0ABN4WUJ8_9HYPH|nr:hypothetical protein [Roseibium aggregatum]AQQ05370.1 hypothetical protein B0E33_18770 [Roseibium aggregatum]